MTCIVLKPFIPRDIFPENSNVPSAKCHHTKCHHTNNPNSMIHDSLLDRFG